MLINLRHLVVFFVAFLMMSVGKPKSRVACVVNYGRGTQLGSPGKLHFEKKQINSTQEESSGFKRKYRSKCTEVTTASIQELAIIQYYKFSEYVVLIGEKSVPPSYYCHCPERGPPKV